jgi:hypothetical protein
MRVDQRTQLPLDGVGDDNGQRADRDGSGHEVELSENSWS